METLYGTNMLACLTRTSQENGDAELGIDENSARFETEVTRFKA